MAILIVLQNRELATEIATFLRSHGEQVRVCPSATGPEFLREFPTACLFITDLAPPVLGFLSAHGENLLRGGKPLLVLASPGHVSSFQVMLASGTGRCVAIRSASDMFEEIGRVVGELTARSGIAARKGQGKAAPSAKMVAADDAHADGGRRSARRAISRQVRLVNDIAHDLRTPLTAIGEFAHLMDSGYTGEMTAQQRRYVQIIERRCDEATRMVYDLLDGARLQAGRMHPHRQGVAVRDVLIDVRDSLVPAFRHTETELVIDVPEGLPRVFADRDMLARILANLVSNAVKFSPPRTPVLVRVERHSVSRAGLSVIDSGVGISPADLRRIFHRYEQGPNRMQDGIGLGLAIVRELVKLQGGRVTVQSTLGKGSTFYFTLPLFLPSAVIRRYLSDHAKTATQAVSAWLMQIPEPGQYDAIHRLVTSSVRARDLVLPDDDRRRLVLATDRRDPKRLLSRLRKQIAAYGGRVPVIEPMAVPELKRYCASQTQTPHAPGDRTDSTPLAG